MAELEVLDVLEVLGVLALLEFGFLGAFGTLDALLGILGFLPRTLDALQDVLEDDLGVLLRTLRVLDVLLRTLWFLQVGVLMDTLHVLDVLLRTLDVLQDAHAVLQGDLVVLFDVLGALLSTLGALRALDAHGARGIANDLDIAHL